MPLFDSGDVDGLLYFVMPYQDGLSLRARLDRDGGSARATLSASSATWRARWRTRTSTASCIGT
jgi:hypothetical protein